MFVSLLKKQSKLKRSIKQTGTRYLHHVVDTHPPCIVNTRMTNETIHE